MTPIIGHFEPDPNRPQFRRLVDAMNHNATTLGLQVQGNPKALPFLIGEFHKTRDWIERRNSTVRELIL